MVDHVLGCEVRVGVGHDERDRYLAEDGIGLAHDRDFEDSGQAADRVLDLLGVEVLSAPDDHVFDPVDEGQIAVLVEPAHVSGPQPAVDDGLSGRLRIAEIARHHDVAGDEDLAARTGRYVLKVLIDDPYPLAGQRLADGAGLAGAVQRVQRGGAGALGQPVALEDRDTQLLLARRQQFPGRGRGPAHDEPQRRHVPSVDLGDQKCIDGRDRREEGGPQSLDFVEEPRCRERFEDRQLAAHPQRRQQADHECVGVEERQHQQAMIVCRELHRLSDRGRHHVGVGVADHHALGAAGGAAGVDQQREVGRRDRRRLADGADGFGGQVADGDARSPRTQLLTALVDHQYGAGVLELMSGLDGGERRIDRCDDCAQSPSGEHGEHQLDAVGQHHGNHVAVTDSMGGELRRHRSDAGIELGEREFGPTIAHSRGISESGSQHPREIIQSHQPLPSNVPCDPAH